MESTLRRNVLFILLAGIVPGLLPGRQQATTNTCCLSFA